MCSSVTTSVTTRGNHEARSRVIEYYRDCRNDYRIIWRTDENGTIHFGYFDDGAAINHPIVTFAQTLARGIVALAAAIVAAIVALVPVPAFREAAVRALRVAARGRVSRHDAAQRRMTEVCAEAVQPRPGERLLDAGCGVGGTDRWLAERYRAFVCGLNVQHDHLAIARQHQGIPANGGRVCFSRQDYTEMGIASESCDIVWGLESICHCQDKSAFIREASRVLRPGGRLMIADFFLAEDALSDRDAFEVTEWTRGWAIPNLASTKGFFELLEAHGFANVRQRDITANVLPSSHRLYKASLVASPIHRYLERLGARSTIQGANISAAHLQYRTLRDHVCAYAIFTAEKPIRRTS